MGHILFIHKDAMEKGQGLQDAIAQHFTLSDFQVAKSFSEFKTTLRTFTAYQHSRIVIIMIASKDQLTRLHTMEDHLKGMRLVLILPDESKTTRSMALKLYPRFFTSRSTHYDELLDVLETMMSKK